MGPSFLVSTSCRLDQQIEPYSENVAVEGGVRDLAQRQTFGNDGLAQRILVRDDVGRVEKLPFVVAADGTSRPVRSDHPAAEPCLVEPPAYFLFDVGATGGLVLLATGSFLEEGFDLPELNTLFDEMLKH